MRRAIARAMRCGASYSDLYFENTEIRSIKLRDGAVASCSCHIDCGTGVRALDGERTGYSYCESTDVADILRAADAASTIAAGKASAASKMLAAAAIPATSCVHIPSFYGEALPWEDVQMDAMVQILNDLEARLRAADVRITKVSAGISCSRSSVVMYNSLGQLCADERPMGSISATIVFTDGKLTESRSASRSFRAGAEILTREDLVADLLRGIEPMLQAGRPKGGTMPVVIASGAGGILLHEAMGHAFEADFNRKDQSAFSHRMGSQICPKGIFIVDDATFPGNRGACNVDDEGVPGQKTYMVTDGILTSYLHDRISAAHYGVAPTGNGRRESFRFEPIPRMRLTYMENGTTAPADIISSVKKGIYVDEFSNGEVQIGQGDFTFYVKSGYLIENGRLGAPIKDINIMGNGPQCLQDIRAVGNDLRIDNSRWICGKGQSVPVGCGMPTVLVGALTVGGD